MIFIFVCAEVFGLLGSSKTLQAVETYATSTPRVGSGDNMTCKGFCWQGKKDALVVAVFIRVLHEKNLTKFWTNSVYSTSDNQDTRDADVTTTIEKLSQQGVELQSKTDAREFMARRASMIASATEVADAYHQLLR